MGNNSRKPKSHDDQFIRNGTNGGRAEEPQSNKSATSSFLDAVEVPESDQSNHKPLQRTIKRPKPISTQQPPVAPEPVFRLAKKPGVGPTTSFEINTRKSSSNGMNFGKEGSKLYRRSPLGAQKTCRHTDASRNAKKFTGYSQDDGGDGSQMEPDASDSSYESDLETVDPDKLDFEPPKQEERCANLPLSFKIPEVKAPATCSNATLCMRYGYGQLQGKRAYQEDMAVCMPSIELAKLPAVPGDRSAQQAPAQAFFAVFDGHNGAATSKMLQAQMPPILVANLSPKTDPCEALVKAFQEADKRRNAEIRRTITEEERDRSGSTACCVLLWEHRLLCANAGDSRAVLCRAGAAIALSEDHKAVTPKERARVEAAGGWVRNGRVMGVLAAARGFGDVELKRTVDHIYWEKRFEEDLVSATPDVVQYAIVPADEFVVMGSDGIWDAFGLVAAIQPHAEDRTEADATAATNLCAINFVRRALLQDSDIKLAAEKIVQFAVERTGKESDNCTAIVIMLNQRQWDGALVTQNATSATKLPVLPAPPPASSSLQKQTVVTSTAAAVMNVAPPPSAAGDQKT